MPQLLRENAGRVGKIEFKNNDIIIEVPEDSPSKVCNYTASAWMTRPFVARFVLNSTAVGTGKKIAMTEADKLSKVRLFHGIPSRPNVPVLHFTAVDNHNAQEFAVVFYYYHKGDHLTASQPAGTMGGGDVIA